VGVKFAWGFLLLALAGFADAAYLSMQHFSGAHLSCPLTGGCDRVLTSAYATLGPIPVALLGAVYYLAIFLLAVIYLDTRREGALKAIAQLSYLGLLAAIGFVGLQIMVIEALCFYCLISAALSVGIFALARLERRLGR
jgi:uncharacterized membrane protein